MVIDILRMLEEGKTSDEVIKAFPQLSVSGVSACIEYAPPPRFVSPRTGIVV